MILAWDHMFDFSHGACDVYFLLLFFFLPVVEWNFIHLLYVLQYEFTSSYLLSSIDTAHLPDIWSYFHGFHGVFLLMNYRLKTDFYCTLSDLLWTGWFIRPALVKVEVSVYFLLFTLNSKMTFDYNLQWQISFGSIAKSMKPTCLQTLAEHM